MNRVRSYNQVVNIKTNRQPGTSGVGPITEAGVAVGGSGGSEAKTVT